MTRPMLAILLFPLAGCGAIMNGRYQTVTIDSAPTSATIEIDGKPYTTPARLKLLRCKPHTVAAKNANDALVWRVIYSRGEYVSQMINLLTLPIISNIVDAIAGTNCELNPDSLTIPLPPPNAGPEFRSIEQWEKR